MKLISMWIDVKELQKNISFDISDMIIQMQNQDNTEETEMVLYQPFNSGNYFWLKKPKRKATSTQFVTITS